MLGTTGRIETFSVGQNGKGAFAYYLTLLGTVELGTPVIDAQGRLLSIVDTGTQTQRGQSFVLPVEAFEWLRSSCRYGKVSLEDQTAGVLKEYSLVCSAPLLLACSGGLIR